MITGNKGEWSELYVLLYLLGTGKLYSADEKAVRMQDVYFPILRILRNEDDREIDYHITHEKAVEIIMNGQTLGKISVDVFKKEADFLLTAIREGSDRAFPIARTEDFMSHIHTRRLAAPSSDKTDITLQLQDIHTGYEPIMGFSIKSELGNPPTLLNASGATNFVYAIDNIDDNDMYEINAIDTRSKIVDRMMEIRNRGGKVRFSHTANRTFANNLMLIDSNMERIVAEMLYASYLMGETKCGNLVLLLEEKNPLSYPSYGFYAFKFKRLLSAIALGMKPSVLWDGVDEANGGYIIVTSNGDVIAYHIYNRNFFEQYLLVNTRFEKPSTTRHGYASIYKQDGKYYINLNLQIRFK